MRTFTRSALIVLGSAALVVASTVPASAATSADSIVTTTVEGGVLAISAPATLALSAKPGAIATADLVGVSVVDERAGVAGWVASVSTTAFSSATLIGETIPATGLTYTSGIAVTGGTATVTASAANASGPVQTATAVNGNNSAVWDATVSVAIPSDALAANDYTATLTHSVS